MLREESIRFVGESVGVESITPAAVKEVGLELQRRLELLVRDACLFMKHSRREKLTRGDIEHAFRLNNVPSLYGHIDAQPETFKVVNRDSEDIFFLEGKIVSLDAVLNQPLMDVPIEASFATHWLAIDGQQPQIPQNLTNNQIGVLEKEQEALDSRRLQHRRRNAQHREKFVIKGAAKHSLSKEQQMYYDHVTSCILEDKRNLKEECFRSLRFDDGLSQLVPYFSKFVADTVDLNLTNLPLLISTMKLTWGLLNNPRVVVDSYLHQILPAVLTCVVGSPLCRDPSEDHWQLRRFAADLVGFICDKYGSSYVSLKPRITKTLTKALYDINKPLVCHFGAIVALTCLGSSSISAVSNVVIPSVCAYLDALETELESLDTVKRFEAYQCFQAMLDAVGMFVRQHLDTLSSSPKVLSVVMEITRSLASQSDARESPRKKRKAAKEVMDNHGGFFDVTEAFGESLIPRVPGTYNVHALHSIFI